MRRVIVLDPCLTTRLSHNYSAALALVDEANALGLEVRIYCHADAHESIRTLPAEPLFRQTGYGYGADPRAAVDFVLTDSCRRSTLGDLKSLAGEISSDDLVLVPTVTSNLVEAFGQWLAGMPLSQRPAVAMCLMFEPDRNMAFRKSDVALAAYRRALLRLNQASAMRLVLVCETATMADIYAREFGIRPQVLATPTHTGVHGPRATRPNGTVLGFLGGGRREKGLHLLPEIVDAVRMVHPQVRYLVQCYGFETGYVRETHQKLLCKDGVELVEQPLSNETFRHLVSSCRALLLPYDAASYGARGSALYSEGRSLGIPMVLPAQTAFGAEAVADGIAVSFGEHSAAGIAQAVVELLDDLERYEQSAARLALEQDAPGRGYLRTVLGWLDS